ncbi:CopD family protein [Geopsychrobacter electrodiphilus]|uniref:CopD family protein n=1 Tax=Geopsychrobacter electrodiphilus TaxID=225196 RepID=UPI00035CE00D|nr:CopD family protein [Geopsychrobacter electrodiphilus]
MMRVILVALLLFCWVVPALATPEFAAQTGQNCSYCHLDPAGGGELTAQGESFIASQAAAGTPVAPSGFARLLRLLVGSLHLLTAVFWFGTIFYVHLVLKPAYAAKGLPRGEVRVGLVSMAIMALTGLYLTWMRFDSWQGLVDTRFGQLLLVKVGLFAIMVTMGLIAVFIVGPRLRRRSSATTEIVLGDMTSEQLVLCDGQEGRPACFAFKGKIYDASQSPMWKKGQHMQRHSAGTDLTVALGQAPHGEDRVMRLPEVGSLLASGATSGDRPKKQFFFLAYLNLILAVAILLIVAFWRWG